MNEKWRIASLCIFVTCFCLWLAGCGSDNAAGTAPAAPTGVVATAGNGQVVVNWLPVAGATSYNVYRGPAAGVTKASGTKVANAVNPQAVTLLTNGTPYFFVVTAQNAFGESVVSVEVTATPAAGLLAPSAPTGVTATAGSGQVTVSWSPVIGATSYNIYYATAAGVTTGSLTNVIGAVSPRVVASLTNATPYFFVVTALNSNGESVVSSEVTATPVPNPPPAAPTGVTATAGNGQVTVAWNTVTGATSYNIYYATAAGVTKASPTNVINAVSPRAVTALTNGTTYFFVVTAVNANGESVESGEAFATPVAPAGSFTQADLTGTWNFIQFRSGPDVTSGATPGWLRGNVTIDASGNVTVNSVLDSNGSTAVPLAGTITEMIDANGVVTEGGTNGAGTGNHAVMAANKQLVVGTNGSGTANPALRIFVKQVGTFTNADLTGPLPFAYHELESGVGNSWLYGAGTIDNLRQVTLTSAIDPAGPGTLPPANFTTLSINAAGIVTSTDNGTTQGVMTPDKKVIFFTESNGTNTGYTLRIVQLTGQTFAAADLAGTWRDHVLASSPTVPAWEYDTISFTSGGVGTTLSKNTNTGNTTVNPPFTANFSSAGAITSAVDSSVNGTMSFAKNMIVVTSTFDPGVFSLDILLK